LDIGFEAKRAVLYRLMCLLGRFVDFMLVYGCSLGTHSRQ
jgi:hypothetical protein